MESLSTLAAFAIVGLWVAIIARVGVLLYRYAPRVGAAIGTVLLIPWPSGWQALEPFLISTAASAVAMGITWKFIFRPRNLPLVWYVTLWVSILAVMATWVVVGHWLRGASIPYALADGFVAGIRAGSFAGLLTFAVRGPVHDPADDEPPGLREQVRSFRLLAQQARTWLQRA